MRRRTKLVDDAMQWKQSFSERTDAEMAVVTQFAFEAQPVLDWIASLREANVDLPVHVGIAGPAKLQTLIKFAIACGVGPSLKVLQKRAMDVTKLMLPYEPTEVMADFAEARVTGTHAPAQIHFFPLGGIKLKADPDFKPKQLEKGDLPYLGVLFKKSQDLQKAQGMIGRRRAY